MSNLTPDEAVIFTAYDRKKGVFIDHAVVDLAVHPNNTLPRQSIETKLLARFR